MVGHSLLCQYYQHQLIYIWRILMCDIIMPSSSLLTQACYLRAAWGQLQRPCCGCYCLHRHLSYPPCLHGCILCLVCQKKKTNHPVTDSNWERTSFTYLLNWYCNISSSKKHGHYCSCKDSKVMTNGKYQTVFILFSISQTAFKLYLQS